MIRIEKKQSNVFNAMTCVKNSISKDKTKEYLTVAYFDKELTLVIMPFYKENA